MEQFLLKGQTVTYAGKPYFIEMVANNDREIKKWGKRRQTTYQGSFEHFMYTLLSDQIQAEGFENYNVKLNYKNEFVTIGRAQRDSLLRINENTLEKKLRLNQFLKVVYLKRRKNQNKRNIGNMANELSHPGESDLAQQGASQYMFGNQYPTSYLFAKQRNIPLNQMGVTKKTVFIIRIWRVVRQSGG